MHGLYKEQTKRALCILQTFGTFILQLALSA